ncbi:MAG: lipopolysaccharide biosynthesis protein [Chloroflexi bacterium]|nr:MAG: lipopolysaccharide biosynthesis protein [Chloroflexota bacterium]
MGLQAREVAARAVQGSLFNVGASLITATSGFVRSVLLARLLAPEQFGVMTLALFFLSLVTQAQRLGFNRAFIHRQDDSPDNLATFATLRIGLTGTAVLLALAGAPILGHLYPDHPGLAPVLAVLALLEVARAFNSVAETLLTRALQFRRLAVINVASSLTMTVVAPLVALAGGGVWALVAEQATGVVVRTAGLWLYRRPWRPRLGLNRDLARWYFRFGTFVFANTNLTFLLDRFDDFWTGTFLGATALGFYSRAYEFARYPRRLLSGPLVQVFFPTFALLQRDRLRLSRAFYRISSLIIRVGFLVFGAASLVAPEFIRLILGPRWMPMAVTFQLMLVYTLFDPLVTVCGNLLAALGQPHRLTRIQLVRVVVFIPAVILFSKMSRDINGVALAVDLMLLVGIILLFHQVREHVDFSLKRLLLVPSLGLGVGVGGALGAATLFAWSSDWASLVGKFTVAAGLYLAVSLALEGQQYIYGARLLWHHLHSG